MAHRSITKRLLLALAIVALISSFAHAQGVKRLIMIKVDGLPGYLVDDYVKKRDPATGRSMLPWFDEIFYKNGTTVSNFYSRGESLSAPAWGQLDTGQHLQIKGNVEFDRLTMRSYDYLAVVPYFTGYALNKGADTRGVEVLDQLGIPLLYDAFPYERRYTSNQLFQRGVSFENLGGGFINVFPRDRKDLIDEWTLGFDFRNATIDQSERDIIGKVSKRPEIDYYDFYDGNFDHISHHNSDMASRIAVLKRFDATLGRIWLANQGSTRADETAIVLVSDHGFNSEPDVYSQGFNLVKLLGSMAGGGHHVVTKRRLMLDYSIKGLNPFVPLIKTGASEPYYLAGQSESYPTATVDFDGNERSTIHLRESRLNMLHILLQQMRRSELDAATREAAKTTFFRMIDERRVAWQKTVADLTTELAALRRSNEAQEKIVAALPKKFTVDEIALGKDKEARRIRALADNDKTDAAAYSKYLATLTALRDLDANSFDPKKVEISSVIAPGAMGEANSFYELQNYVVGLGRNGLVLASDGSLDLDRSFAKLNYFDLLTRQTVRNNVQKKLGNRPIDFIAVRLAQGLIAAELPEDMRSDEDAVLLYGGPDKQALLLLRTEPNGDKSYRYVPVAGTYQNAQGKVSFQFREIGSGFPLKIFEDKEFTIPAERRAQWLNEWHSELEWLRAVHKTQYSNAIIALNEQLHYNDLPNEADNVTLTDDQRLIRRFRLRQRYLTEADMLVLVNDHWNFDVRGFNPGGNHGSFFRVSTNSTLMLAGGSRTGIPRGLVVEEPYDSLSVVPTIFALMGKIDGNNRPNAELYQKGFRKFPGRVIREIFTKEPPIGGQ